MILTLFFTRNTSLQTWVETGMIDREKQIYHRHLNHGLLEKVYWITYGPRDREIARELYEQGRLDRRIEVLDKPRFFSDSLVPNLFYSRIIPWLYRRQLAESDILKTNQMPGAEPAIKSKRLFKKPLLLRTGYTQSRFSRRQNAGAVKIAFYENLERQAYRVADSAAVSSEHDKEYLCGKYGIDSIKINVLRNYIDTETFRPLDRERRADRLLFVGRLNRQKNLPAIIEAAAKCGFPLDIYGIGELEDELRTYAKEVNANINFKGTVANTKLPEIYNRYRFYMLCSYYEGMPKTLLEAMACGCVSIATPVEGISEVIADNHNGILAEDTSAKGIVRAIERAREADWKALSARAMETIHEKYTLEVIARQEETILRKLTGQ